MIVSGCSKREAKMAEKGHRINQSVNYIYIYMAKPLNQFQRIVLKKIFIKKNSATVIRLSAPVTATKSGPPSSLPAKSKIVIPPNMVVLC